MPRISDRIHTTVQCVFFTSSSPPPHTIQSSIKKSLPIGFKLFTKFFVCISNDHLFDVQHINLQHLKTSNLPLMIPMDYASWKYGVGVCGTIQKHTYPQHTAHAVCRHRAITQKDYATSQRETVVQTRLLS